MIVGKDAPNPCAMSGGCFISIDRGFLGSTSQDGVRDAIANRHRVAPGNSNAVPLSQSPDDVVRGVHERACVAQATVTMLEGILAYAQRPSGYTSRGVYCLDVLNAHARISHRVTYVEVFMLFAPKCRWPCCQLGQLWRRHSC